LCMAAQEGHEHAVRILVQEFGDHVHLLNSGWTALCIAAEAGHEHVVRASCTISVQTSTKLQLRATRL
jgi:ankyrin repeat protein